ncbi:MAG: hypothetical protein H6835_01665 [Planctomycetes bacterium]|nr:hypothetical protein [Planctomycetota bacterium]
MQTFPRCVVSLVVATLPIAALVAQRAAPAAPTFALPAGEHRLEAFVDLLGQITRQPIACDEAALAADEDTVHVARDLRLDGDAFEDVARTLLFRRGFVIVADGQARRVVPLSRPELYTQAPQQLVLEAVLARPACVAYVTTTLPCAGELAQRSVEMLRPFFSFGPKGYGLSLAAVDGGVQLTGITDQVAYAVQLLRVANGEPLQATAPLAWSTHGELAWPGGKTTLGAFAATFGKALDADLLIDHLAGASDASLDLGEAAQLAPAEWFARSTQLLRGRRCVVVPLLPQQRVFELLPMHGPRADEMAWRVRIEPCERVADTADVVPVATIYTPQHIGVGGAMGVLRAKMQGGGGMTVSTLDGVRLLLCAPRDELATAIAALQAADVE